MVRGRLIATMLAGVLSAGGGAAQEARRVPYWASISSGQALMRTGPGKEFPARWLYQRRGLPVRVTAVHGSWRKVADPAGESGWMLGALLTAERGAIVTGGAPRPLRSSPDDGARVSWRAAPGVVGRIDDCGEGWCRMDVGGKRGWVRVAHIWGVDPGEVVD